MYKILKNRNLIYSFSTKNKDKTNPIVKNPVLRKEKEKSLNEIIKNDNKTQIVGIVKVT